MEYETMMKYYTLDENNQPVECGIEEARIIQLARTSFQNGTELSTIFIGMLTPIFETAYLHPTDTDVIERYESYEEAMEGHQRHLERIREATQ